MTNELAAKLLEWYARHARSLPWRSSRDPYAIWVSEIMLQQTRVETVLPYYERWMQRFPNLQALASAAEQDVLHCWEGLGYYSRARNLHHAAQIVVQDHQGQVPSDRKLLEKLPGIGRYTAGAVASIAFGLNEAALDGNIRRVLSRVFNMDLPARSLEGEKRLWALAIQELPEGKAGDHNQALMDLGSSICTPTKPTCLVCPLVDLCQAAKTGRQEELPVLESRAPVPHITVTAAVIHRDGLVLIARRPPHGLLGGMWEFPGGTQQTDESLQTCLKREIIEELGTQIEVGDAFGVYEHAYTHLKVTLHAFTCVLIGQDPRPLEASELCWVDPVELANFPMGKIDRQISRRLLKKQTGG
ncbi:MAG: A/G-specific adenine glycosylase [Anaerolineaceae bacterium]|nr:A/G-specific adenine glycosylase [Anaerolineaceae bacterium]